MNSNSIRNKTHDYTEIVRLLFSPHTHHRNLTVIFFTCRCAAHGRLPGGWDSGSFHTIISGY